MGAAGDKLFGQVTSVSPRTVDDIPEEAGVQPNGGVTFLYSGTTPEVNKMVEVDGAGKVRKAAADADIAAGGHLAKGQVMAVDTDATTCDVWLG